MTRNPTGDSRKKAPTCFCQPDGRSEPVPETPPADCPQEATGTECLTCGGITIHVHAAGDVHIHNHAASCGPMRSPETPCPPKDPDCAPKPPSKGACIPAVPGAKHKQGRDEKLARLAQRAKVPSALAASVLHTARRFVSGETAGNSLEAALYRTLGKIPRDLLACAAAAYEAAPSALRDRVYAPSISHLGLDQSIGLAQLSEAFLAEVGGRAALAAFGDPLAAEGERPGRDRSFPPLGEFPPPQVRICQVNEARTFNYDPPLPLSEYQPHELQYQCVVQIVSGQPQQVCTVQTSGCPGNSMEDVCARVYDVAIGETVTLQGVNFCSVDARVRFIDPLSAGVVLEAETQVWGDLDTPLEEEIGGQMTPIRDCRVKDLLTFQVPSILPPQVYQIQVAVPNVSGISSLGPWLTSNVEHINVQVPDSARFQILVDTIIARKETSPTWAGSDELGLMVKCVPLFLDGTLGAVRSEPFEDIQDVEFDSATRRDVATLVFEHAQPLHSVVLVVLGHEIDSDDAYRELITTVGDYFVYLIEEEWGRVAVGGSFVAGVAALIVKLGGSYLMGGIGAAIALALEGIYLLWAPCDLIIEDVIALSASDLMMRTEVTVPPPPPSTSTTENGIEVRVNLTISPVKSPYEYKETREYVCEAEDSRYELIYKYTRTA